VRPASCAAGRGGARTRDRVALAAWFRRLEPVSDNASASCPQVDRLFRLKATFTHRGCPQIRNRYSRTARCPDDRVHEPKLVARSGFAPRHRARRRGSQRGATSRRRGPARRSPCAAVPVGRGSGLLPGVVLLSSSAPTRRQLLRAALAYAGDGAVITGVDAARLNHDLRLPPADEVHLLVPAAGGSTTRATCSSSAPPGCLDQRSYRYPFTLPAENFQTISRCTTSKVIRLISFMLFCTYGRFWFLCDRWIMYRSQNRIANYVRMHQNNVRPFQDIRQSPAISLA